jgi:hypothetical protein
MNVKSLLAAPVAAALVALASPAAAAPTAAPAAAAEPSAAAKDLARQLAPKETWETGVKQLSAMVQQNLEGHPGAKLKYPADLSQRIRVEVEKALPYDELVAMHAKELQAGYSEAELKEYSTFFKTPAGKKWLAVQPKASEAVAVETQKRFEKKVPEIMGKMSELAKTSGGGDAKKGAEKSDAKRAADAKKTEKAAPKGAH